MRNIVTQFTFYVRRRGRTVLRNKVSLFRALQNLTIVAGGLVVTRLTALAFASILAYMSNTETFGKYTLFTALFLLISEVSNTLDVTFIRFANTPGNSEPREVYLATYVAAKIVYALVVCLAGWLVGPLLAEVIFNKPDFASSIHLAIVSGTLFGIYNIFVASFQQQHRFINVSLLRPAFNACILIILSTIAVAGIDITSKTVSYIYFASAFLLAVISLFTYRSILIVHSIGIYKRLIHFYRIGSIFIISGLISLISNRMDVFILSSFLAFEQLADYGVAIRISGLAAFLTGTIATILLPKAPAALKNHVHFKRYLFLCLLYATLQTIAAAILIIWLAPIISLLFGVEYVSTATITAILIIQALITSYGSPFQALIQAGRTPSIILLITSTKLVISSIILLGLVSRFGILGAATGAAIIAAMSSMMLAFAAFKYSRPLASTISRGIE